MLLKDNKQNYNFQGSFKDKDERKDGFIYNKDVRVFPLSHHSISIKIYKLSSNFKNHEFINQLIFLVLEIT